VRQVLIDPTFGRSQGALPVLVGSALPQLVQGEARRGNEQQRKHRCNCQDHDQCQPGLGISPMHGNPVLESNVHRFATPRLGSTTVFVMVVLGYPRTGFVFTVSEMVTLFTDAKTVGSVEDW
jgi:hypothetical protein